METKVNNPRAYSMNTGGSGMHWEGFCCRYFMRQSNGSWFIKFA